MSTMARSTPSCDLLLLNASNYSKVPIFPYAFVQVSEIARRNGLRVAFHDLLGTPRGEVKSTLERLLREHRPRAIGLHIRQTDSLLVEDYRVYEAGETRDDLYLPVEETRRLLAHIRALSTVPVLLGGHGFSASPKGLFETLAPDLAVVGEPDGLFARFDDVLARKDMASVPNLVWRDGDRVVVNPRTFFPPAPGPEYTAEIIDAVRRFYGERFLDGQTFPVEVMRGCPYRCYFCVEPGVKGQEARMRDLDAVMADVELLASNGLNRIWFVCSELNVFGPDLALAIAGRIVRLAEKVGHPIHWYAFSLPVRMSEATWRTLVNSGFRGGFNTFMSLDDDNLRTGRIPHRAVDAVEEYKIIEKLAEELGPDADDFRSRGTLALFFGNAFATVTTVARSLALLREHGVLETARVPLIMSATRIFEVTEPAAPREDNPRYSFDERGLAETSMARLPSYEYPKALLDHFGGREAMDSFFTWVQTTILSRQHDAQKDWSLFLANVSTPVQVRQWLDGRLRSGGGGPSAHAKRSLPEALQSDLSALVLRPDGESLGELFFPAPARRAAAGRLAFATLVTLLDHFANETAAALRTLGLSMDLAAALDGPVYDVLEPLYARFDGADQALAALSADRGDVAIQSLAARVVFYARNVVLDPRYRAALFVPVAKEESAPVRLMPAKRLPMHPA
jgi:hypothetical protein